ncbi:RNB domain-containing ribonuclease [Sphingomonas turrisvirgatae]|uniref:RNB domain-containing ribonuclease n=1 Tax=Sphingomonas turrisvirgatae TaxID=1888892 RepID=A0A1E3LTQ7_9SPHN|nr:RNB domain-containing ribonuclease [Sphingomonas turrisvirgatae]ODP37148.1 RNB domain-containing ribonuclease [Sphingomonas turrisvirgatae]
MKTLRDPANALAKGLAAIRTEFDVPEAFPPAALAEAERVAQRVPDGHADWTALPFVTLDPASATDLDQAFCIEAAGGALILHYAIADVAWFVDEGGALDSEAWRRGETLYLPDGRAGLYPPMLAERAASLLPDGPRPAVVFTVRVAGDGAVAMDAVTRAVIRSRAKLAYSTVQEADLPAGFAELSARIAAAEAARGAARVDPPEQELARDKDGALMLAFRERHASEDRNAALSLACNMAVADLLQAHRTGLFRVMAEPDDAAERRLRLTAQGLGIDWPDQATLTQFERTLDPRDTRHAALMLAIRRAGNGASYRPWRADETPWHAAVAAPYAHATAPLRRLADRYVIQAALAVGNGRAVPDGVSAAFDRLPKVMARAGALAGRIDRAVIDMAEAVMLAGCEGRTFDAVVTDIGERGASIQLADMPVTARIDAAGLTPGDPVRVRLTSADPSRRAIAFEIAGAPVS